MDSGMLSDLSLPQGHLPPPALFLSFILCSLLDHPFYLTALFHHPFRMTFSVDLEVSSITIWMVCWVAHTPVGIQLHLCVWWATLTINHYSHTSPALASQKHSCNFHFFYSSPPFALPIPCCSKTWALLPEQQHPGVAACWRKWSWTDCMWPHLKYETELSCDWEWRLWG